MEARLKPNQYKAAALLAKGIPGKEVAAQIGVTPETISRWHQNPHFQAYTNQVRYAMLEKAVEDMRLLAADAVKTVKDVMLNSESDAARIKAAAMVFQHTGMTDPAKGLWGFGIGPTSSI